jgi:hypothetical protein
MKTPLLKLFIFSILVTFPALGAGGEDNDLDFLPPVESDTKIRLNKKEPKEVFSIVTQPLCTKSA